MNGLTFGIGAFCLSLILGTGAFAADVPADAKDAQIVFLGELHDNPNHHATQAEWVAALAPKGLVFEMLAPQQAASAPDGRVSQAELDAALGWSDGSWPSFDMYFPIFAAAPEAVIYGAGVTRAEVRAELEKPLREHPKAAQFGLDRAPDLAEQEQRVALQIKAHCDALPAEVAPRLVDAQRLRDMALADAALRALEQTGGPVVVITGNGHARKDWGAPALIAFAKPQVKVFALGQGEDGQTLPGQFDHVADAPAPSRADPCEAFKK